MEALTNTPTLADFEDIPPNVLEVLEKSGFTEPDRVKKFLLEYVFSESERIQCNTTGSDGCSKFDEEKMAKLKTLLFKVFNTWDTRKDDVWKDFCSYIDKEGQYLRMQKCFVQAGILLDVKENCSGNRSDAMSALSQHIFTDDERTFSNTNGKNGFKLLPKHKMDAIKEAYFKVRPTAGDNVEAEWEQCCNCIDVEASILKHRYLSRLANSQLEKEEVSLLPSSSSSSSAAGGDENVNVLKKQESVSSTMNVPSSSSAVHIANETGNEIPTDGKEDIFLKRKCIEGDVDGASSEKIEPSSKKIAMVVNMDVPPFLDASSGRKSSDGDMVSVSNKAPPRRKSNEGQIEAAPVTPETGDSTEVDQPEKKTSESLISGRSYVDSDDDALTIVVEEEGPVTKLLLPSQIEDYNSTETRDETSKEKANGTSEGELSAHDENVGLSLLEKKGPDETTSPSAQKRKESSSESVKEDPSLKKPRFEQVQNKSTDAFCLSKSKESISETAHELSCRNAKEHLLPSVPNVVSSTDRIASTSTDSGHSSMRHMSNVKDHAVVSSSSGSKGVSLTIQNQPPQRLVTNAEGRPELVSKFSGSTTGTSVMSSSFQPYTITGNSNSPSLVTPSHPLRTPVPNITKQSSNLPSSVERISVATPNPPPVRVNTRGIGYRLLTSGGIPMSVVAPQASNQAALQGPVQPGVQPGMQPGVQPRVQSGVQAGVQAGIPSTQGIPLSAVAPQVGSKPVHPTPQPMSCHPNATENQESASQRMPFSNATPQSNFHTVPPVSEVLHQNVLHIVTSTPQPFSFSAITPSTAPKFNLQVNALDSREGSTNFNQQRMLHLQYNQVPGLRPGVNQVQLPSSTFLPPGVIPSPERMPMPQSQLPCLIPANTVASAVSQKHYEEVARSTVLQCGVVDSKKATASKATVSGMDSQGDRIQQTTSAQQTDTCHESNSAATQPPPTSHKIAMTTMTIAVPTTMPTWILINPAAQSSSPGTSMQLSQVAVSHSQTNAQLQGVPISQSLTKSVPSAHIPKTTATEPATVVQQSQVHLSGSVTSVNAHHISVSDSSTSKSVQLPTLVPESVTLETSPPAVRLTTMLPSPVSDVNPLKRMNTSPVHAETKKICKGTSKTNIIRKLSSVSAHRLYVVTELLKFIKGNLHSSTNPAAEPLDDKELEQFKKLYMEIYKPKVVFLSKIGCQKIIKEVVELSLHDFGLKEAQNIQSVVSGMSSVGLARSEKVNRLARILFTEHERAFCSATGKEGFARFCKSRMYVLEHAYLAAVNCKEIMEEQERGKLWRILDSTAILMRKEMMQQAGVTNAEMAKQWLRSEKGKAFSVLSQQQQELDEERRLADSVQGKRDYLDEKNLGSYVMSPADWMLVTEIGCCKGQSSSACEIKHLAEAILTPVELLLCGRLTRHLDVSSILVKLGFLRQAYFLLNPFTPDQSSCREWIKCRVNLEEFFNEIERQVAILRCVAIPAHVKLLPLSSCDKRQEKQSEADRDIGTAQLAAIEETANLNSSQEFQMALVPEKPSVTDLEEVTDNLGAYVVTSVVAVHLNVVKCLTSTNDRQAIVMHILQKIIADDSATGKREDQAVSHGVYLAFLRQCIYWVFPEETEEQRVEIWKHCIEHVTSLLPRPSLEPAKSVSPEARLTDTNIQIQNNMIRTTPFLGPPCSKEVLGATVPTLEEVEEMNRIKENASNSKEMIVKELIVRLFTEHDLASIPVCRALRRLPCSVMKLTRLRHAYFWMCPCPDPETRAVEWTQCWSYITIMVKHMMECNQGFLSLIYVPRTIALKESRFCPDEQDSTDQESLSESFEQEPSEESCGTNATIEESQFPIFIKSGAVKSECPTSWHCKRAYIMPIPYNRNIIDTESGKRVPLPLGVPVKFGAYVMTREEAMWMRSLKRKCKLMKFSKEDAVKQIIMELYTTTDIIYLHFLKRGKKVVFCPIKMAIFRQVFFELYPPDSSLNLSEMWSHCCAYMALVAEEVRKEMMKSMMTRKLKVVNLKPKGKLLNPILPAPSSLTEPKSEITLMKCRGKGRLPLDKSTHVKHSEQAADLEIACQAAKSGERKEPHKDTHSSSQIPKPFFIECGAVEEDHRSAKHPTKLKHETSGVTSYGIDENGKKVKLIFGVQISFTKLGAYVMTEKESKWVDHLKEQCQKRSLKKLECVELIAQNIFTLNEIRNFLHRKKNKQMVFHSMKVVILRQVYYRLFPLPEDASLFSSWQACWVLFTKACQRLRMHGIRLQIAAPPSPSKDECTIKKASVNVSAVKYQAQQADVKSKDSKEGKLNNSVLEEPSANSPKRTQKHYFRPFFLRVLQCFSWDAKIVVKYLMKNVFTMEELLSCKNIKVLDQEKLDAVAETLSTLCGPLASSNCYSFMEEFLHELTQKSSWNLGEKGTPLSVRKHVSHCAKLTGFKGGRLKEAKQSHSFLEDLSQTDQCITEKTRLYTELLDEDGKDIPKYKLERCTYIANKLVLTLFSHEELMMGSITGTKGMCPLDPVRIALLKHATFIMAGVVPSQRERTWQNIHHDVDQEIHQYRSPFLTEDRRIEKFLECAVVVIKSSRGRSNERSQADIQLVSCSSLLPAGLHRDLLINAKEPTEVIKRLMDHVRVKDEDWDSFTARAASKMKIVKAVFLSIRQVPTHEQADRWTAALQMAKQFLNKGCISLSEVEVTKSPTFVITEARNGSSSEAPKSQKLSQSDAKASGKGVKKNSEEKVDVGIPENVLRLLKCFKWNADMVVRLLIQLCFSDKDLSVLLKEETSWDPKKRRKFQSACKEIFGDAGTGLRFSRVKEVVQSITECTKRIPYSAWTKNTTVNFVQNLARITGHVQDEKNWKCAPKSEKYEAFVKKEFPSLPSGEISKCLLITERLLDRFYSKEELLFSNCRGRLGWLELDSKRQHVMKHVVCTIASVPEHKRALVWKTCCNSIERKITDLRRQIVKADEEMEKVIQSQPFNMDDHVPDHVQDKMKQHSENAVTLMQYLVPELFAPAELKGEADEMPPAQMKLLQVLFFRTHNVELAKREESWRQALRTISYLNKMSGYSYDDGSDAGSSKLSHGVGDSEGGMDLPEAAISSDEEMPQEEQYAEGSPPSKPLKAMSSVATISQESTPKMDKTKGTKDDAGTGISVPALEQDITKLKVQAKGHNTQEDAQSEQACTVAEQSKQTSDVVDESIECPRDLSWYALEPVVTVLLKHARTLQLEEDEVVFELIMHIYHAKDVLDNKDECKSSPEKLELLTEAFCQIYDVPETEREKVQQLLKEFLLCAVDSLHCLLKRQSDGKKTAATIKTSNKPKAYPPVPDLDSKINIMRCLLEDTFSADERLEMDALKLRKLKASKVESVMNRFLESCQRSGDKVERKSAMTLVYNLTVKLQEYIQNNVKHTVDSFISAYVHRMVSLLEEKAKEHAKNDSQSVTPLFQFVIQELSKVFKVAGFIPFLRVLLRYLFTPADLKTMQEVGMEDPSSPLTSQLELMQRTIHKVVKVQPQEKPNFWSCTKWIITKEIKDMNLPEDLKKRKAQNDMFMPVYHRKAVLKCVMGVCLNLEEQPQFRADPKAFEKSNPEKVKHMKTVYCLIRNIEQSNQDHEWNLVMFPKRNYPIVDPKTRKQVVLQRRKVSPLHIEGSTSLKAVQDDSSPESNGSESKKEERRGVKRKSEETAQSKKILVKEAHKADSHVETCHGSHNENKASNNMVDSEIDNETDKETTDEQPFSDDAEEPRQLRKTIVVLVDYETCDKVCKILAEEERKLLDSERKFEDNSNVEKEILCSDTESSRSTVADKETSASDAPESKSENSEKDVMLEEGASDQEVAQKIQESSEEKKSSDEDDRSQHGDSTESGAIKTQNSTELKDSSNSSGKPIDMNQKDPSLDEKENEHENDQEKPVENISNGHVIPIPDVPEEIRTSEQSSLDGHKEHVTKIGNTESEKLSSSESGNSENMESNDMLDSQEVKGEENEQTQVSAAAIDLLKEAAENMTFETVDETSAGRSENCNAKEDVTLENEDMQKQIEYFEDRQADLQDKGEKNECPGVDGGNKTDILGSDDYTDALASFDATLLGQDSAEEIQGAEESSIKSTSGFTENQDGLPEVKSNLSNSAQVLDKVNSANVHSGNERMTNEKDEEKQLNTKSSPEIDQTDSGSKSKELDTEAEDLPTHGNSEKLANQGNVEDNSVSPKKVEKSASNGSDVSDSNLESDESPTNADLCPAEKVEDETFPVTAREENSQIPDSKVVEAHAGKDSPLTNSSQTAGETNITQLPDILDRYDSGKDIGITEATADISDPSKNQNSDAQKETDIAQPESSPLLTTNRVIADKSEKDCHLDCTSEETVNNGREQSSVEAEEEKAHRGDLDEANLHVNRSKEEVCHSNDDPSAMADSAANNGAARSASIMNERRETCEERITCTGEGDVQKKDSDKNIVCSDAPINANEDVTSDTTVSLPGSIQTDAEIVQMTLGKMSKSEEVAVPAKTEEDPHDDKEAEGCVSRDSSLGNMTMAKITSSQENERTELGLSSGGAEAVSADQISTESETLPGANVTPESTQAIQENSADKKIVMESENTSRNESEVTSSEQTPSPAISESKSVAEGDDTFKKTADILTPDDSVARGIQDESCEPVAECSAPSHQSSPTISSYDSRETEISACDMVTDGGNTSTLEMISSKETALSQLASEQEGQEVSRCDPDSMNHEMDPGKESLVSDGHLLLSEQCKPVSLSVEGEGESHDQLDLSEQPHSDSSRKENSASDEHDDKQIVSEELSDKSVVSNDKVLPSDEESEELLASSDKTIVSGDRALVSPSCEQFNPTYVGGESEHCTAAGDSNLDLLLLAAEIKRDSDCKTNAAVDDNQNREV